MESEPKPEPSGRFFYGYYLIAVAFSVFLLTNFWPLALGSFRDPMMRDVGISATEFGVLYSVSTLAVTAAYAIAGVLVGRSIRLVLSLALILCSLGLLAMWSADSIVLLILGFGILLTFGTNFGEMAGYALVVNWFSRHRGTAIGIASFGGSLSGLMAPAAVWMIAQYDWRPTLLIFAIGVPVVLLPVIWLAVVDTPEERGDHPDGEPPVQEPASNDGAALAQQDDWPLRRIVLDRRFLLLSLIAGTGLASVTSMLSLFHVHATSIGVPAPLAATAISMMSVFGGFARFASGWLADRFPARLLLAVLLGLQIAGIALVSGAHAFWQIALGAILFGSYSGGLPPYAVLLASWFGARGFPRALGVLMVMGLPLQLTFPILAGRIYEETGAYSGFFPIAIGVALVGLLLLATIPSNVPAQRGP